MSSSSSSSLTATASSFLSSYVYPFFYRSSQVVFAILAVAAGLLYVQQESLLYYPSLAGIPKHNAQNPRGYRHPGERGIATYTSHIITSRVDGVQIHAWFVPHPTTQKLPTIMFFHGNAGNIGLRLPNMVEMLRNVHAHVMLVEYRGYGDSPGDAVKPTEAGLKQDGVAAWEYARTELVAQHPDLVDPQLLYVFGRSLGGAVAFTLAAHAEAAGAPLAGCIVENTFTSISDMVDQVLPWLTPIKPFVLRIGWNSLQLLQQGKITKTPMLFLAGDADNLVPHKHMQKLRDVAHLALMPVGITPAWHVVHGGTHNETWMQGGRPYWQAWASFILHSAALATKITANGASSDTSTAVSAIDGTTALSSSNSSAIPLMNNSFMGMARDAWSGKQNSKKKE